MHQVRALLFDVFGTVVDWRNGVAREARQCLIRWGRADIDPNAFADAWRGRYGSAMEAVRNGSRPFVRLDVLHYENLCAVLESYGIDWHALEAADLAQLNTAWHRLDPWPDAVAGLARLKRSFIIAPLSNGNISLLLNMAKRAGLPWDAILGAEIVQTYKPVPAAYLKTAEVLGLAPEQCMLVAAHNNDLRAARACGFRTGFVLRSFEHGPGQRTDVAAEEAWDVVADDLVQFSERLGV
ncbi:MAG: haloacid dehalogenase type II [Janthinobacterium lividum]